MAVPTLFIKNLKVLMETKTFNHDETKLILLTIQEAATLSTVDFISVLDNLEVVVDESNSELGEEEYLKIKKELLE